MLTLGLLMRFMVFNFLSFFPGLRLPMRTVRNRIQKIRVRVTIAKKTTMVAGEKRRKMKSKSKSKSRPREMESREIVERAKAKGIVFGYPGKRPSWCSSSPSSSYDLRTAEKVPYHRIMIEDRRKYLAEMGRLAVKYRLRRRRREEQQQHKPTPRRLVSIHDDPKFAADLELIRELYPRESTPDPDADDDAFIPKAHREQLKDWEEHLEDDFQAMDIQCAEAALDHYNRKHDVKYELTETIGAFSHFIPFEYWYHCNFWARPTSTSECADCSPKLFFAELVEWGSIKVKHCCILNDKHSRSQFVRGCCDFCPKEMAHPVRGFKVGRPGH